MIKVDIRPYGAELHFTYDREEFLAKRAEFTDEVLAPARFIDADGISSDYHNGMTHVVGCFGGRIDTLAHELSHVCIKVLGAVNVPINPATSEAFCYLLGDLVSQCLKHMMEHRGV